MNVLIPRWARAGVRTAVWAGPGAAILLLAALSPVLRESLVALEPVWPPLVLVAAVVAAFTYRIARARGNTRVRRRLLRLERGVARVAARLGWALAALLFLVPVWAHWQLRPPGVLPAYAALWGDIPFADARGHFEGATRLLTDGSLGAFSERRPLSAAWLASRLALTGGRLRPAVVIQALLLAGTALFLARAVALRWGTWSAMGAFAIMLGLSRDFLPTVLTETLAIALGGLGTAILVGRPARASVGLAALGLACISAALYARPGPQFLLLALMAWLALTFRTWPAVALAVAAGLSGLAVTAVLNAAYGSGESSAMAYPAYTLYGLATGSNYRQVRTDFPEESARLSDKAMSRRMYARAIEKLRRDPAPFFDALRINAVKFMRKTPGNVFRLGSLRTLFRPSWPLRSPEEDAARNRIWGAPPILASLAAAVLLIARSRGGERSLWSLTAIGVLASVPFVYGDSGFRILAAAYPFLAVLLALGLAPRGERPDGPERRQAERHLATRAAVVGSTLLALILAGPALARALSPPPPAFDRASAAAGRVMVIAPAQAAAIVVSNAGAEDVDRPRLARRDFSRALETVPVGGPDYFERLRPPFAILSAYDRVTARQQLLVAPVDLLRSPSRWLRVEVHPVPADPDARSTGPGSDDFFEVERWSALPP